MNVINKYRPLTTVKLFITDIIFISTFISFIFQSSTLIEMLSLKFLAFSLLICLELGKSIFLKKLHLRTHVLQIFRQQMKLFVISCIIYLIVVKFSVSGLTEIMYPRHREHFVNPNDNFKIDPQMLYSTSDQFNHYQKNLLIRQHNNAPSPLRKFINYGNANLQQGIHQYGYGNMNLQGNIQQILQ